MPSIALFLYPLAALFLFIVIILAEGHIFLRADIIVALNVLTNNVQMKKLSTRSTLNYN